MTIEEAHPMDSVMFALVSTSNIIMSVYRTEESAQAASQEWGWDEQDKEFAWSVKPIMTVKQYMKHPQEQKLCLDGRPCLGYIDYESKYKVVYVYLVDEMIYTPEDVNGRRDNVVCLKPGW